MSSSPSTHMLYFNDIKFPFLWIHLESHIAQTILGTYQALSAASIQWKRAKTALSSYRNEAVKLWSLQLSVGTLQRYQNTSCLLHLHQYGFISMNISDDTNDRRPHGRSALAEAQQHSIYSMWRWTGVLCTCNTVLCIGLPKGCDNCSDISEFDWNCKSNKRTKDEPHMPLSMLLHTIWILQRIPFGSSWQGTRQGWGVWLMHKYFLKYVFLKYWNSNLKGQ